MDTAKQPPEGKLDQQFFLAILCETANQMGFQVKLLEADENHPLFALLEIDKIGKIEHTCQFQICFLPGFEGEEWEDMEILQIYCPVFVELPLDHLPEVDRACVWCNRYTIAGAFGTQPELGFLFYRISLPLRGRYGMETCVRMATDVLVNALYNLNACIDGLAAISRGMMNVEEAAENGYLPGGKPEENKA